jgi:hypothetical protein
MCMATSEATPASRDSEPKIERAYLIVPIRRWNYREIGPSHLPFPLGKKCHLRSLLARSRMEQTPPEPPAPAFSCQSTPTPSPSLSLPSSSRWWRRWWSALLLSRGTCLPASPGTRLVSTAPRVLPRREFFVRCCPRLKCPCAEKCCFLHMGECTGFLNSVIMVLLLPFMKRCANACLHSKKPYTSRDSMKRFELFSV